MKIELKNKVTRTQEILISGLNYFTYVYPHASAILKRVFYALYHGVLLSVISSFFNRISDLRALKKLGRCGISRSAILFYSATLVIIGDPKAVFAGGLEIYNLSTQSESVDLQSKHLGVSFDI